jgi:hypothetical protein
MPAITPARALRTVERRAAWRKREINCRSGRGKANSMICAVKRDAKRGSARIDPQLYFDNFAVIELAHSFGVAGFTVGLRVNLVFDIRRQRWKSVSPVWPNDVGFDCMRAGIGNVNDCIRQRSV